MCRTLLLQSARRGLGNAPGHVGAIVAFQKHARVNFGGSLRALSGRNEIWSCTVNVSTHAAAGWWLASPQTYMEAIADDIKTWFTAVGNHMSASASLDYLKVNNINPDGTYAEAITHSHTYPVDTMGGVGQIGPAFLSIVTTFETDLARGYAHRGRVYLPNNTFNATGSQISDADATTVRNTGAQLLTKLLINEPTGGALVQPCVVSKHAAELNDISGVSVDTVYDFQSRRKNRTQGNRVRAAWP